MNKSDFFYSSGAMGFGGEGYFWHKLVNFTPPDFQIISKTVTLNPNKGTPWIVIPFNKSIYNHNGLHNDGFYHWLENYYKPELIASIHGNYDEISEMVGALENYVLMGIELNYSCPNVKSSNNKKLPRTNHKLYLKLHCGQDPYQFDLDKISSIHLNSVPMFYGGISGKLAQKYNWGFIQRYSELSIAGCSFLNLDDIHRLEDMGCREFGIGAIMFFNRKLLMEIN